MQIPEELKKEYLHVPLWAWLLGLGGGAIVGLWLRRRNASTSTDNTNNSSADIGDDVGSDLSDGTYFPGAGAPDPVGGSDGGTGGIDDTGGTGTTDPGTTNPGGDTGAENDPSSSPGETPAGGDTTPPPVDPSTDPNTGGGGPPAAPGPSDRIARPAIATAASQRAFATKQAKSDPAVLRGAESGKTLAQSRLAPAKPLSKKPSEKHKRTVQAGSGSPGGAHAAPQARASQPPHAASQGGNPPSGGGDIHFAPINKVVPGVPVIHPTTNGRVAVPVALPAAKPLSKAPAATKTPTKKPAPPPPPKATQKKFKTK